MLKIVIKKRMKLKTKSFLTEGLTSSSTTSTRSSTLNINTLCLDTKSIQLYYIM